MTDNHPTVANMIFGVIIFVTTLAAWLWGEKNGVNTDVLWVIAVPVITALFIGNSLGKVANATQQTALQTNGTLDTRIENAVTRSLASRDVTRAKQSIDSTGVATNPATIIINEAVE